MTDGLTRPEAAALLWATRRGRRYCRYLPLFCLIGLTSGAHEAATLPILR